MKDVVIVKVPKLNVTGAMYAVDHLLLGSHVTFEDCENFEPAAVRYLVKSMGHDVDKLISLVNFGSMPEELVSLLAAGKVHREEREEERLKGGFAV